MDQIDENKVAVFGGSHGGFLTTHLIGQYPVSVECCIKLVVADFFFVVADSFPLTHMQIKKL